MNQDAYNISKIFPQTECLSQDTLLRYVRNELPKMEVRMVENHILDCPLCNAAVEGLQSDQGAGFEALAASLRSTIQDRVEGGKVIEFPAHKVQAAPKRRSWAAGLSIAAAVAILFTFAFAFFGNQPTASSIADEYFRIQRPHVTRGGADGDVRGGRNGRGVRSGTPTPTTTYAPSKLDEGKTLMINKDYEDAIAAFNQVNTGEAYFLAGDCHYQLEQFEAAALNYEKVIARQDSEYAHMAEFNLALTNLKLGKIEVARVALEKIAQNPDHIDHSNAGKALESLAKIDAH